MIITQGKLDSAITRRFNNKERSLYSTTRYAITEQLLSDATLKAMAHDPRIDASQLAFLAFRKLAEETLKHIWGENITGLTDDMLRNWLEISGIFHGDMLNRATDYINTIRATDNERSITMSINTTINENQVVCERCGEIIDISNAKEVNGKYYCEHCFDRRFAVCEDCGEIVDKYGWDSHFVSGRGWYCEECFDERFVVCEHCGEAVERDDAFWINREEVYVCDNCYDEYYVECGRCGDVINRNDSYGVYVDGDRDQMESWCEHCAEYHSWTCEECGERFSDDVYDDEEGTCDRCRNSRPQFKLISDAWIARRGVQGYSWKPDPLMCVTPNEIEGAEKRIYYGFELEVDKAPAEIDRNDYANMVNDNSGYTYVKRDGSLSNGMEIVSHPATIDYHMSKKDTWEMIFNELLSAGFTSHDAKTCGLHVHISLHAMEEMNPLAVSNMLFLMDHFWDKLVRFSRRTESQLNQWARRYSQFHGDYKEWKRQAKDYQDRYYALNLQNRHTVEIRMFRGTLNLETFMATLQFVHLLTMRCVEITSLSRLQSITWEELIESDYPELNAYLLKRGLKGTEEEIAAAQAAEKAREEERRRRALADIDQYVTNMQARIREAHSAVDRISLIREACDHIDSDMLHAMFREGDRVRIICQPDGNPSLVGLEGTVRQIYDTHRLAIAVRPDLMNGETNPTNGEVVYGLHDGDIWNCEAITLVRVSE